MACGPLIAHPGSMRSEEMQVGFVCSCLYQKAWSPAAQRNWLHVLVEDITDIALGVAMKCEFVFLSCDTDCDQIACVV